MKLNIGCGTSHYDGYINIDANPALKPDLVCNVRNGLPYPENSVEEILFVHVIEHIPDLYHLDILKDFHRVLEPGGVLVIAFPEFVKCAQNYMDNKKGLRKFWKATIYGRQLHDMDFHVALMDTKEFTSMLEVCGFVDIKSAPEPAEDFNTIIRCKKGARIESREEVLTREVFYNA